MTDDEPTAAVLSLEDIAKARKQLDNPPGLTCGSLKNILSTYRRDLKMYDSSGRRLYHVRVVEQYTEDGTLEEVLRLE